MAKRVAVLMKLKANVSKEEIHQLAELLRKIGDPEWTTVPESIAKWNKNLKPGPKEDLAREGRGGIATEYNDEHGDPVFYIP